MELNPQQQANLEKVAEILYSNAHCGKLEARRIALSLLRAMGEQGVVLRANHPAPVVADCGTRKLMWVDPLLPPEEKV